MPQQVSKFVLVTGTAFTWSRDLQRVARMMGRTLAEAGFGLVTGNAPGIDRWIAGAYCAERRSQGQPLVGAFVQIALEGVWNYFRRGGPPLPGFAAPKACRVNVHDGESWRREAIERCDAAVMVGGRQGSLDIAKRCIERGVPVFPLPFTGGWSGVVFQEILRTWDSLPVPGLSRTQFLRLAEPWVSGTGALADLLRGTLAEAADIFVSYRRSDAPAAAGRIAHDLAEHFGQRRVFFDVHGIAPSSAWDQTIMGALDECSAGVIVIGPRWLAPLPGGTRIRLMEGDDVVRDEVTRLLRARKAVFPILVEGATLPEASALPDALRPLLKFQGTVLDNGGWTTTMGHLVREIGYAIQRSKPQDT